MNNQIRIISIILIASILPFLIYAFLQLQSLDEDEARARNVYEKQLETILFSLNQHADDVMSYGLIS